MSKSKTITVRFDKRYFDALSGMAGDDDVTVGRFVKDHLIKLADGDVPASPISTKPDAQLLAVEERIAGLLHDSLAEISKAVKVMAASHTAESKKLRDEISQLRKGLADFALMFEVPQEEVGPSLLEFEE